MADSPWEYVTQLEPPSPEGLGEELKKAFGLSKSPLHSLYGDDDWAFVLKMYGYVEASLNQMLIKHFNNPKTDNIVHKLDTGHDGRGKLAFVRAFELLPPEGCAFVKKFSNFRATIVHGIEWIDLDLKKYFLELSRAEQGNWKNALTWWWSGQATEDVKEMAIKYPRQSIFSCSMQVMTHAVVQNLVQDAQQNLDQKLRELGTISIYRYKKNKPTESTPSPT